MLPALLSTAPLLPPPLPPLQVVSLVNNTPVTWPTALVTYFNVASQASSATSSLASLDCSMSADVGLPKSAQVR